MKNLQQQQLPSAAALAMAIALEHPALSTDQKTLCSIAGACRSWRDAVQQCEAGNTAVALDLKGLQQQQLCSFALWLPKHAGLVKSMSVSSRCDWSGVLVGSDYKPIPQSQVDAVQQRLSQLLQLAAAPTAQAAAAATATPVGPAPANFQPLLARAQQPQQQRQQQLRLASFKTDCLLGPGMLSSLPAYSLTRLDLKLGYKGLLNGPQLSAALAQLSSLQQLRIAMGEVRDCYPFPGSALAGIAQLSKLTSLTVAGEFQGLTKSLQQLLMQPLPLQQLQLDAWDALVGGRLDLPVLDMTNMTHLQELSSTRMQLREGTALPHQLPRLAFGMCTTGITLTIASRCQQLQYVSCQVQFNNPEPLLQLAALPALQHVALDYWSWQDAAGTSASWAQLLLQQLRVFSHLDCMPFYRTAADQRRLLTSVMGGVSACTRLTELLLDIWPQDDEVWRHDDREHLLEGGSESEQAAEQQQMQVIGQAGGARQNSSYSIVCGTLVGLASLKNLQVTCRLALSDVAALTSLTGLTRLAVHGVFGEGVDCVTAVLQRLQDLQHLDVEEDVYGMDAVLNAAMAPAPTSQ